MIDRGDNLLVDLLSMAGVPFVHAYAGAAKFVLVGGDGDSVFHALGRGRNVRPHKNAHRQQRFHDIPQRARARFSACHFPDAFRTANCTGAVAKSSTTTPSSGAGFTRAAP